MSLLALERLRVDSVAVRTGSKTLSALAPSSAPAAASSGCAATGQAPTDSPMRKINTLLWSFSHSPVRRRL